MKVSDYAALYGVHPNTVRNWALKGYISATYSKRATRRRYIVDVYGIAPLLRPGRKVKSVDNLDPPWDP